MSLFRRVTRYRISPSQDPRENRLTEVTAAVLEEVDGLAYDVMERVLASAATAAHERIFDAADDAEVAELERVRDELALQLERLRHLDGPRLRVATQVTTASTKFVDLELRFLPRAFEPGDVFVFWLEVKHGADVHGTQLTDYEGDIGFVAADQHAVIVLAPRQSVASLTGVPDLMPVVEWQRVAEVVREWTKRPGLGDVERFLLTDYLTYLEEEGLMDDELLTAEHAFVLRAMPAAENAVAKVMELTDDRISQRWGARGDKKGGSRGAQYGPNYWAHYELAPDNGQAAAASWRNTTFEWGLLGDQDRDEPRNAYVFFAGATFTAKDNPTAVVGNKDWLAAQRRHGFEHLSVAGWWRLVRFRYPEELLSATTLDGQVAALGDWVVESFRLLAATPPPH